MWWIFDLLFKEKSEDSIVNYTTANGKDKEILFSWTNAEARRWLKNNCVYLYNNRKLKYIFKEYKWKSFKVDLYLKTQEIMHDDNHF